MNKRILITASLFGMLAVVFGAFGAHALKDSLPATELEVWKTGVNYQFYHALALLFLAVFSGASGKPVKWPYYAFTSGIILFSGSLYLLSTSSLTGFHWFFLGPVTPIGGLLLISGWMGLLVTAIKSK